MHDIPLDQLYMSLRNGAISTFGNRVLLWHVGRRGKSLNTFRQQVLLHLLREVVTCRIRANSLDFNASLFLKPVLVANKCFKYSFFLLKKENADVAAVIINKD